MEQKYVSKKKLRDSKRCRSKRAGSSIVVSSIHNAGRKDRHADFLRDFDARRLNPFENTFVTAEGGLQRFIPRSVPTRPCSIFLPARDLRIQTSWDFLPKDTTRSIALARMPFGSPMQQGPRTGITFDAQTKSLTPISKIKRGLEKMEGTKKTGVVLVTWGEFNPIHLTNIHMFECARKMLEERTSFAVVGGFICPARDKFVQFKCRSDVNEAIPSYHRTRMCELMVRSSSWIDVDRWEVTRHAGVYDNLSALEHVRDYLAWSLPDQHVHVMYVRYTSSFPTPPY